MNDTAKNLPLPKNKKIERALQIYLDQLVRVEFVKSYKQATREANLFNMAEEGMIDYLEQLD
ncbi:MAG: hypothetical protein R2750_08670 [Bacteroidales bacterium]